MMPRIRLLILASVCLLILAVGILWPILVTVGYGMLMVVTLVAIVDWLRAPDLGAIEVAREHRAVLSVGARNPVTLWLRSPFALTLTLHDEYPTPGECEGLPATVELAAGQKRGQVYHTVPHRRGRPSFGHVFLRTTSPWGCWTVSEERPLHREVRVYPDIQAVRKVELLARRNRLAEAGVRLSKLRGRGSEFDRLREYRREDEQRNIDWKATARVQDLVTREYSVERNQNLILVLDAGRSMCQTTDGVSHFDYALNAALLSAYVATRQGDTVGLMIASRQVLRWAPPVRGRNGVERLISQVYDVEPEYEATDYGRLAEELRCRCRKRSLVIFLTHALDDVHLEAIAEPLRRMRSPHLVLGAFIENRPLRERAAETPKSSVDAFQIAAAADLLGSQEHSLRRLQESGLLIVETPASELAPKLISRYLDIKAKHLL